MFDKEYSFAGTHAQKVIELTSNFNEKTSVFKTNIDVFIIASIVGFLFQKKSTRNNEKNKSDKVITTKIFLEAFKSHQTDLYFAYRLIMLADRNNEPQFEKRINKAFKDFYKEENIEDLKLFEEYVLGGIDILYEKLLSNAKIQDDYVTNLYEFIEDLQIRYFHEDNEDNNLSEQLINIARS